MKNAEVGIAKFGKLCFIFHEANIVDFSGFGKWNCSTLPSHNNCSTLPPPPPTTTHSNCSTLASPPPPLHSNCSTLSCHSNCTT